MSLLDQTIKSLASFLPLLSHFVIGRHILLLSMHIELFSRIYLYYICPGSVYFYKSKRSITALHMMGYGTERAESSWTAISSGLAYFREPYLDQASAGWKADKRREPEQDQGGRAGSGGPFQPLHDLNSARTCGETFGQCTRYQLTAD